MTNGNAAAMTTDGNSPAAATNGKASATANGNALPEPVPTPPPAGAVDTSMLIDNGLWDNAAVPPCCAMRRRLLPTTRLVIWSRTCEFSIEAGPVTRGSGSNSLLHRT